MTTPLLVFVQVLPSLYQSIACFDRIEEYCVKAPFSMLNEDTSIPNTELSELAPNQMHIYDESAVEFHRASFAWCQSGLSILQDLQLVIKRKSIATIIGPVGSGKSTLLESILGETVLKEGSRSLSRSPIAYCPQTAWIINDTIRQNIIGPSSFDAKWYKFVSWACALESVFEEIPEGDSSRAGSSGVTLSGGQKQRIVSDGVILRQIKKLIGVQALARAVYSSAPILILDDVFSGLDTQSISTILSRLLAPTGYFRKSDKTVIMATHDCISIMTRVVSRQANIALDRLLPYADEIVILDEGTITKITTYAQIRSSLPQECGRKFSKASSQDYHDHPKTSSGADSSGPIAQFLPIEEHNMDTSRRDGKWSVYTFYLQSAGWTMTVALAITIVLFGVSDRVTSELPILLK